MSAPCLPCVFPSLGIACQYSHMDTQKKALSADDVLDAHSFLEKTTTVEDVAGALFHLFAYCPEHGEIYKMSFTQPKQGSALRCDACFTRAGTFVACLITDVIVHEPTERLTTRDPSAVFI